MQARTPRVPQLLPDDRLGVVDIVSGSFGAGHDAAAREIAHRLEGRGYATRTWDVVDLLPGLLGRGLRAAYLRQIQSAPGSWRCLLRGLERHDRLSDAIARTLAIGGGALLDLAATAPAAIVSTHPFASQALGSLRASGRLDIPTVTYLTDLSVHRLWVHEGVDLHLALHALPAADAVRLGAGRTLVVQPAVPRAFGDLRASAPAPALCRRTLGLPQDRPLALVTGGSRGIGDLERTADDIARTGLAVPVVLCGHHDRLRRRLAGRPDVVALSWVDEMTTLYGAVDVVVQNAGGFTSLEALASGVPLVTYRTIAGHGETNAEALARAGWVPWLRTPADLAAGLARALARPRAWEPCAAAAPDVVDAMFGRVAPAVAVATA